MELVIFITQSLTHTAQTATRTQNNGNKMNLSSSHWQISMLLWYCSG